MNKFIIAIDDLTQDEKTELQVFVEGSGMGWWHWIGNFWMISTSDNDMTIAIIRNNIRKITNKMFIVIKVDNAESWSGYGESEKFEWLQKNWQ